MITKILHADCKVAERDVPLPVWAFSGGHDVYGTWASIFVGDADQRLRWIPPGRFWMGSPEDEPDRFNDECPRHEVELTQGFWLFDTPCTQKLWKTVMGKNRSSFKGKNRPADNVNWYDCREFMYKVHKQIPGLRLQLPTEAQWEYSCRAGTDESRYHEDIDAIAWHKGNFGKRVVKKKRPNAWGLYDMLGSLAEWCHDGKRDYTSGVSIDPKGTTEWFSYRVIRGSDWSHDARYIRAAYREGSNGHIRVSTIGFRCLSLEE